MSNRTNELFLKKFCEVNNNADLAFSKGNYHQAAEMLKGIPITIIQNHINDSDLALYYNSRGLAHKRDGQFHAAIRDYLAAKDHASLNDPLLNSYENNLAITYYELGDWHKAISLIDSVLNRCSCDDPDSIFYSQNKATFLMASGYYEQAARLLSHANAFYEMNGNDVGPNMIHAMERSGELLIHLGLGSQALRVLTAALQFKTNLFGDQSRTADCMVSLSKAHILMAQWDQALTLINKASSLYQKQLSPDSPYIGRVMMLKGYVVASLGQFSEAEKFFSIARSLFNRVYSENGKHSDYLLLDIFRGEMYSHRKEFHTALAIFKEAYNIHQDTHSTIAHAILLNNLGYCLHKINKYREAWNYLSRSRKLFSKLAPHHQYLQEVMSNMMNCLRSTNHNQFADSLKFSLSYLSRSCDQTENNPQRYHLQNDSVSTHSVTSLCIIIIGDKDLVHIQVVQEKLENARAFWKKESRELQWMVCNNIRELLKYNFSQNDKTLAVIFHEHKEPKNCIAEDIFNAYPALSNYRHLSWIEQAILVCSRKEETHVYCESLDLADRFKREDRRFPLFIKKRPIDEELLWFDINMHIVHTFTT